MDKVGGEQYQIWMKHQYGQNTNDKDDIEVSSTHVKSTKYQISNSSTRSKNDEIDFKNNNN